MLANYLARFSALFIFKEGDFTQIPTACISTNKRNSDVNFR